MKARKFVMSMLIIAAMLMLGAMVNSQESMSDTDALLAADRAWSQTAEANQPDEFYATFVDDAVMLAPNAPIAEGKDAIKIVFDQLLGLPGLSLKWQPTSAFVSGSSDLGYSFGTYVLKFNGPDGAPVIDNGKYMTVWKKDTSGVWKVAADMFNTSQPLPESGGEG